MFFTCFAEGTHESSRSEFSGGLEFLSFGEPSPPAIDSRINERIRSQVKDYEYWNVHHNRPAQLSRICPLQGFRTLTFHVHKHSTSVYIVRSVHVDNRSQKMKRVDVWRHPLGIHTHALVDLNLIQYKFLNVRKYERDKKHFEYANRTFTP